MNDDNDERFALRATNVNQPQLLHVGSRQSISATEEYESAEPSLSSVSGISVEIPAAATARYSTPPEERQPLDTNAPFLVIPHRGSENTADTSAQSTRGTAPVFQERSTNRKIVDSSNTPYISVLDQRSPPTPGIDDTPYIRFALDQLTRDEEVRGSRWYGAAGRHDDLAQISPASRGGVADAPPPPAPSSPLPPKTPKDVPYLAPINATPRLATPRHLRETLRTPEDIYIPFEPSVNSLAYPSLRFLPQILHPLWLGIYLLLCLLSLAGLLFAAIYPITHGRGLSDYTSFGGSRYFVFEYLPTLLGMLMLLWLLQIQIAIQRIMPFLCMASPSPLCRSEGPHLELHPTSFIIPKLFYFRAGQPVIGVAMIIFWLFLWTVPLLACLFGVKYYGSPETGTWRWVTVQGIVWTVIVLYILLTAILAFLLFWLPRQVTGLKWDPRSLADLIVLINHSNALGNYEGTEALPSPRSFRDRMLDRADRLGYWHTSKQPDDVFYGIGEEGAPARQFSLEAGRLREKRALDRSSFPDTPTSYAPEPPVDLESADLEAIRYHYLPWYLRPSLLLLWCIILFVLYLAFLIVSFVNDAVLHGFAPLTPVRPNSGGFGAANFLYSFLPALIAHALFLAWLSIDYSFRHLQPYASLSLGVDLGDRSNRYSDPVGDYASHTLLLDYPARLPISVTLAAIAFRDLRVAWFSFLSLTAATLPILAGGAFWAQWYVVEQQVRVSVDPPAYYALCVFLAFIAISLPLAIPGIRRDRSLPHASKTLAETISFLYAGTRGRSLGENWASGNNVREEMIARLLDQNTLFAFGPFTERISGRLALGAYRVSDDHVLTEEEKRLEQLNRTPSSRMTEKQSLGTSAISSFNTTPASQQGLVQHTGQPYAEQTPPQQQAQRTYLAQPLPYAIPEEGQGYPQQYASAKYPQQQTMMNTQNVIREQQRQRQEKTTSSEYGDEEDGVDGDGVDASHVTPFGDYGNGANRYRSDGVRVKEMV